MNIGVDLDDTVCLTHEKLIEEAILFDKVKVKGRGIKDKDAKSFMDMFYWNVMDVSNFFDYIKKSKFYAKLEAKPLASEYINKFYDEGNNIIFITKRDKNLKNSRITKKWLKNNGFKYNKVILGCNDKTAVCLDENIDLFIDNDEKNIIKAKEKKIKVYLMDSVYTKKVPGVKKVKNFKEVYELVNK